MPAEHEKLRVSPERWQDAQTFERDFWNAGNRHHGLLQLGRRLARAARHPARLARMLRFGDWRLADDWNYWWWDAFEGYRALPRRFERTLEVGSGPYSNLRVMQRAAALGEMTCVDPLMSVYLGYRFAWVADLARRGRLRALTARAEDLPLDPGSFDLVVCINVLDHVQDMPRCLDEMHRVLRPGGTLVLGQDLTDAEDLRLDAVREDRGHPIKMGGGTLDGLLLERYQALFHRIAPRHAGRNPDAHCGTYLLIGRKRPAPE